MAEKHGVPGREFSIKREIFGLRMHASVYLCFRNRDKKASKIDKKDANERMQEALGNKV